MNLRCKAGDLAIIINAKNPALLGQMVTCVKFAGTPRRINIGACIIIDHHGDDWWELDRGVLEFTDTTGMPVMLHHFPDCDLMPIRPLDESEKTTDHQKDLTHV